MAEVAIFDNETFRTSETMNAMQTMHITNQLALQQLATSLNLPSGCYLVVTAHDELSFDVICTATTKVFGTFIPNPYSGPTPDMDTLVINAESTWAIGDGRAAVVAFGKTLFAGDGPEDLFRAAKGLAWLDTIPSIRKWADVGQHVVALPAACNQWNPTRQCMKSTPAFSRDAIMAVLFIWVREKFTRRRSGELPRLPLEIWIFVICLLPRYGIGAPCVDNCS